MQLLYYFIGVCAVVVVVLAGSYINTLHSYAQNDSFVVPSQSKPNQSIDLLIGLNDKGEYVDSYICKKIIDSTENYASCRTDQGYNVDVNKNARVYYNIDRNDVPTIIEQFKKAPTN